MSESWDKHLKDRARRVLQNARDHCEGLLARVGALTNSFLEKEALPPDDICLVVVGSVGRFEALAASDIDLIPVTRTQETLTRFQPHDQALRKAVSEGLQVKVSQGEDLTRCVSLEELTDPETIGGGRDNSSALTKRILILTEGKQAGGRLPLGNIREQIMAAYSGCERTRGRHVLSLCNDIARYYRTLCIEYKAKADDPAKDWCTRNMKLRHSRKFWYFSCIMTVLAIAESNPHGDEPYIAGLLEGFDKPPAQRLFEAVDERLRGAVGRVIEPFTWFLDFMASQEHRERLAQVRHKDREDMRLDNPFHAIKLNSDHLHQAILSLIDSLPAHQRQRLLSWFLL
jgi:hypothetical protein